MNWFSLLRILAVSMALAGYSAWTLAQWDHEQAKVHLTDENSKGGIALIRLAEAEELWHDPTTLFVDVRSPSDYEFGHILGAILLPEEEFEVRFPDLQPQFERARTIVVYCKSIDCGKSLWTAIRLRNEGLKQTKIYPAGWNEWTTSRLPAAGEGR